jgi:hypothetical protein
MPAVLGGCVVLLAVIGLGFYAVRKMGPGSFRLRTGLLRMFSFSMEIESSGAARKSPCERSSGPQGLLFCGPGRNPCGRTTRHRGRR